jgi:hypothetical protein
MSETFFLKFFNILKCNFWVKAPCEPATREQSEFPAKKIAAGDISYNNPTPTDGLAYKNLLIQSHNLACLRGRSR